MRFTRHHALTASLLLGAATFGCGAEDSADDTTTPATHAVPDFEHGNTEKTPESVAEQDDFTTSDGRTMLHPEDVVFFEFDSSELSPDGRKYLAVAARWMKQHSGRRVVVEGHADPTGPAPYNKDLAMRRALAVKDYLTNQGIAAERISVVSFGEEKAVYDKDDMNRRTLVYSPE
jgi:outer membrane protein OmpA-like peptidoglycan-associated protein